MIEPAEILKVLLIIVTSYLLGSIPTAYLVGKLNRVNIFEVGSGNMGGTNVARALGCGWGIAVLLLDSLKGIVAILMARQIMPDNTAAATVIAALAVVIGHNWSFFVVFITGALRGGKGAATAFGTMLMIAPFQMIAGVCLIGALLLGVTRYVSLAVLVMLTVAVVWMIVLISQQLLPMEYLVYTLVIAVMILWRFRENIQRLLAGTERRLGERA